MRLVNRASDLDNGAGAAGLLAPIPGTFLFR
jgi:hypothetical protein